MKKRFLLTIFMCLTMFSCLFPNCVTGYTYYFANVDVSEPFAGENSGYQIYTKNAKLNFSFNRILIEFPENTSSNYDGSLNPEAIYVNNELVSKVNVISESNSLKYELLMNELYKLNGDITIRLGKTAGIINPTMPRECYSLVVRFYTSKYEMYLMPSYIYGIVRSRVNDIRLEASPQIIGYNADFNISFNLGVNGSLFASRDYIYVRFPPEFGVPKSSLLTSYFQLNGEEPSAVYISNHFPNTLEIVPSRNIITYKENVVKIFISRSARLYNPRKPGLYKIMLSTSQEYTWVESEPFEIYEPQVQDLSMSILPDSVALNSEVNMSFKTSSVGNLLEGEKIYLEFPAEFDITSLNLSGMVLLDDEPVNASFVNGVIQVLAPMVIPSSSTVKVKILKEAGIKTPIKPGNYQIFVYTDADSFRTPFLVEIRDSTVSEVNLSALYSGLNSVNEFMISFKTGPVYTLAKNVDSIILRFDDGFVLPDVPSQNLITVNGEVAPTVSRDIYTLYITTPLDILPLSTVDVKIPETFSIKNPGELGEYGVKVSTSREPTEIESNKLKITPLPVVEFTVNPSAPDGQNGYYKTNPEVMLSTSNGVKVFYKIDEGEFSEFAQTFKMSEGTHFLFVYAVDSSGNKGDIVKKEFAVDTTPPEVKFNNTNSNPVFKGSPGKLSGSVSEPCTLKINEVILELKDNLNFEVELNVYEGMPIAIYARDLAGNASTLLLTAHIDSIPPVITFLNSVGKLQGLNINSIETTESTCTVQVKLDEKGEVFIDSNEMYFDGYAYSYTANLIEGDNQFIIKAIDSAGNETVETLVVKKVDEKKITLQIDSNLATVGSETIELDAPPVIEKGFTLVPLRFISEAFGASVHWNDALKVITINYRTLTIQLQVGSKVALIGTEFKNLDVPPKIMNGITLVPIRFISEAFGAEVSWDGATKTVTIVYKP